MSSWATGLLDSPHLGIHRKRTALGLGFLAVLLVFLLFTVVVPEFVLTDDEQRFVLWMFNGFTGVVLFSVVLATLVAVLYGAWNGGPVLAGAIPVVPVLLGYLLAVQSTVSIDLALALAGGSAGAVVATVRVWSFASQRASRQSPGGGFSSAVVVGTAVSTGAAVASSVFLWRLSQTGAPHLTQGLWFTGALLVLMLVGLAIIGLLTAVPELSSRIGFSNRQ